MKKRIVIFNPSSYLVLVNKRRKLPCNYIPTKLITSVIPFVKSQPPAKKLLRKEAAAALGKMYRTAKQNKLQLVGVSGYRSYYRQGQIYQEHVEKKGHRKAEKVSARPGHSEHQTGLAVDISSSQLNYKLKKEFAETKEGQWLAEHSYKFGFILRYPANKQKITGYQYEPWHFRYVGIKHAVRINSTDLTLDEYRNKINSKLKYK